MVLEYSIISTMDTSGVSVMQKKGSKAINPLSDKVSSEELQTILKFGAQNLFKQTEDKEGVEGKSNKLEEMNLDDILSRAEVHEGVEQSGTALGSAEFLTQFHVSDVAQLSWDELIPKDLRGDSPQDLEDEIPEEFLADSRRRKAAPVNYSGSDFTLDGGSKRKRKAPSSARNAGDAYLISDKEKRALIRGLQKFGDPERRLDDIMNDADLGYKDVDAIKESLKGIIAVCSEAVNKSKPSKSTGKPKVITATYQTLTAINAGLTMQRVEDLTFLGTRLANQKLSSFRITWNLKPVTNWSVSWGSKEDSLLLVGIYKHGYGSWKEIQDDPELPFAKKFFLGVNDKNLPSAIHLQRRSDFLLKALRDHEGKKFSQDKVDKFFNRKVKSPNQEHTSSRGERSKSEKSSDALKQDKSKNAALPPELSDYDSMDETYCRTTLKPVKKHLKQLAAPKNFVTDKKEMAVFIKKNLLIVGNHITGHLERIGDKNTQKQTQKHLWKYASYFWPTDIPSKKYRALFVRMVEASTDDHKQTKPTMGTEVIFH